MLELDNKIKWKTSLIFLIDDWPLKHQFYKFSWWKLTKKDFINFNNFCNETGLKFNISFIPRYKWKNIIYYYKNINFNKLININNISFSSEILTHSYLWDIKKDKFKNKNMEKDFYSDEKISSNEYYDYLKFWIQEVNKIGIDYTHFTNPNSWNIAPNFIDALLNLIIDWFYKTNCIWWL